MFKVGDKVVINWQMIGRTSVTYDKHTECMVVNHNTLRVISNGAIIHVDVNTDTCTSLEIFNSPLYKALYED